MSLVFLTEGRLVSMIIRPCTWMVCQGVGGMKLVNAEISRIGFLGKSSKLKWSVGGMSKTLSCNTNTGGIRRCSTNLFLELDYVQFFVKEFRWCSLNGKSCCESSIDSSIIMPILAFKAVGGIICQNRHDSVIFRRIVIDSYAERH